MKTKIITLILSLFITLFFLASCGEDATCTEHKDQNKDGKCDTCEASVQEPENDPSLKTFEGISLENAEFTYDGEEKSISISGDLPDGATVSYENEKATDAGSYNARATVKCDGYNTLNLSATLTIKKATITGITFENGEFTYDGAEKSITIEGNAPEGVTTSYESAKATDAGVYNAKATLTGKNYETLTLSATLTIKKATITGISAEQEQSIKHNGQLNRPTYTGTLPSGVQVKFIFDDVERDGVSAIGTYETKMVFSGKNYETLTLNVTYKIKINYTSLAVNVINSFGSLPDAWSFMPDSFSPEYRELTGAAIDYSSFVNVSSIPKNGMGKQLKVVYGTLSKMQSALSYVGVVYGAMNTVKSLYTAYLDNEPESYDTFTADAGAFTFTISIDGENYYLAATVGTVSVEIFSNTADNSYGARIELTESTVLKYEIAENSMIVALNILNTGATQVEFVREDDIVLGYVYEYLGAAGVDLVSTSAMIYVDEEYTTIIGTKGDFMPLSEGHNCEVYRNSDGQFVGSEVKEVSDGTPYNTYWFPLDTILGLNTIKKEDKRNGYNADTIYINDAKNSIGTTMFGGGVNGKALSRRYDIEFKTFYFFNYDETKGEYVEISCEIPMIFIQEEKLDEFILDFTAKNGKFFTTPPIFLVSKSDFAEITFAYTTLLPIYTTIENLVTMDMIKEYCRN